MDAMSTRPRDGRRLSSSLPPQTWSNTSSTTSSRANSRRLDYSLDESTLAQRTTALRQLNGFSRPLPRRHRYTTSVGSRSSLASQPVIVRTYSAETREEHTDMSRRPGMLANGSASDAPPAQLPSAEDFSIGGILRAIEPDIESTLDAIAEICGRSRLSLANEYGSHRPPLGEIRASSRPPERGLHPVEEASSSNERLVDDNVVIVGDDTSTVDGRDPYSPLHGLFENLHLPSTIMGYRSSMPPTWGEATASHNQPEPQQYGTTTASSPAPSRPPMSTLPAESKGTGSNFDWGLLGGATGRGSGNGNGHKRSMSTEPVVSEVHLDARADGTSDRSREEEAAALQIRAERLSFLADLQEWLTWFKNVGYKGQGEAGSAVSRSAETRLREVLQRQNIRLSRADGNNVVAPV